MLNAELFITEIFTSIQGETSFSGLPTSFVRLAQCNLRCTWCDTSYSFTKGTSYSIPEIIDMIKKSGCHYVCITGGEPLLQKNVHQLMTQLADLNFTISLETSGSLSISSVDPRVSVILDIKCPGSKMSHKNDWQNMTHLKPQDEIKFVLLDRQDYDYAKEMIQKYALHEKVKEILLSPVHNVLNPQDLVRWVLEDKLKIRLNLQLHKWIWPPETKGV